MLPKMFQKGCVCRKERRYHSLRWLRIVVVLLSRRDDFSPKFVALFTLLLFLKSFHWLAEDNAKIQDYNYRATKEAIQRAVAREPKAADVVAQKGSVDHPFQAHS